MSAGAASAAVLAFRALPTTEQAARLARLAASALREWSLGGARLELVKYRENAVFSVSAADGSRYAIRIHRPGYRSAAQVRSEIQWMRALAEVGVRTPEVLDTRNGDVLAVAEAAGVPEPRLCDLSRWIDGAQLGRLEHGVEGDLETATASYRTIGRIAAVVHEHGVRWPRPEGFSRPQWDAASLVGETPVFGDFRDLDCLSGEQISLLMDARAQVRERLDAFGRGSDRWGLLHGDFLPENVLVACDGLRLIDFDDCGDGWYVFELATALFPLLLQGTADAMGRAYIESYRSVRALPNEHLALLPTMLLARSLSYLGWPVGRPEIHEAAQIAPFLASVVTQLARCYLAGEPLRVGA